MKTRSLVLSAFALLFCAFPLFAQNYLDAVVFGNTASETSHSFVGPNTAVIFNNAVSPTQTARQCQSLSSTNIYGGTITVTMAVDPVWRNYFSLKLWGADDFSSVYNQASDQGRLYLYVPISNYVASATNNYQIGYRHEGDYICLNVAGDHQPLPGRFFYSTTLLPLWMTQGRTSLTLKIVSTGRIYTLGSSGTPPNNNYQFFMTVNSRSIYSAYTHTDPRLDPGSEVQGVAPATTIRPSPGESIMATGGTFQNGVNNYINVVLGTTLTNLTTSEIEALALAYSVSNLPAAYQQPAVVNQVIAGIDSFTTNYFANPTGSVSTGGGNESWGGRFGPLGHAISLLLPQLQSSLGTSNDYGGGNMPRWQAWGQTLAASRDYGRMNRDGHNISNQGMISDQNIFMANMGLQAMTNVNAFSESNAERYLREAVGLSPWLGSDLSGGGSSFQHGTNYFMVTGKGLTREWGYVGNDYGEIAYYAANFYQYTTNPIFRAQAAKMVKARTPFRRPAIEISGANLYQDMESIGLLAWRGANESDGDYADAMAYGDRTQWAAGMRVAGVTLDTNAVGYAKQMLADNQYFNQLIASPNWYSGGSLAANSFDGRNTVLAFADYLAVSNAPDSGVRLPMTDGQPDFAWADEDDGIVAIKHNGERLWISAYWQAKTGTGVNGIGRFYDSLTNYDRYGVLETSPQINFSGSFYVRPNMVDKPEQNFYVPPDHPTNAYAGERIPLGASDPLATDDAPFRGKALFWAVRYGNYLIGINRSSNRTYQLQTPSGFVSATNLITGQNLTGTVLVSPQSTVVLYLNSASDGCPPPQAPLSLNAVGDPTPKISLDWNSASGVTGYNVKRSTTSGGPYTVIANVTTTNFTDTSISRGVSYYYVVSGTNSCGESYYNSMENTSSGGLPSAWQDQDIGTVGVAGSGNYNNGTFTVKGAGADIGGTSDAFNFAYLSMTNDGVITARIVSQTLGKVGVMMRETLNSNSKMAITMLDLSQHTARFFARTSTGGSPTFSSAATTQTTPLWVRLARTGSTFTGYYSADGSTWTPVGTNTFTMSGTNFVGLAATSFSTSQLTVATFDNVTTPTWSPPPVAPTNLAATASNVLVALQWNTSAGATGYNLKRSTISGGSYTTITSTNATTTTDSSVANGTVYYYIVTATNLAGESANSIEVTAQPESLVSTPLTFQAAGNQIQFSWPADHLGWKLQSQTNPSAIGLNTNWTTITGSASTNQLTLPTDGNQGSVFFRLIYP